MKRILVVDDEEDMCQILKILLENSGYAVITAITGREAIKHLTDGEVVDLIISDLKMPDIDGIGLLNFLRETMREIPLVLITAYGSIEVAVEAMKKGAADFITKPFNKDIIRHIIGRIFHIETLENENRFLKDTIHEGELVYRSQAMFRIMETVKKVAMVGTPVLIVGESGSGKELVAKAIHLFSCTAGDNRPEKPFVRIHCPAVPESLLESELFGYQKGAFTGATKDFKGKIRLSAGGTLFLDEIGDLPLNIQPKLLRFLEEKTFEPLGSITTIKVNARIICATNRDLKEMVNKGLFREDLYYRINTINIKIPPLRERKEDIIPIAEYFLQKIARDLGKGTRRLAPGLEKAFWDHHWPGNVRELRNVIERAVVLYNNEEIKLSDLPPEFQNFTPPVPALNLNKLEDSEIGLLLSALEKSNWNITAAARELGVKRSTIRYKIGKYNLKNRLNRSCG
ncbi:MAG: sigma-54 dependent transcriptional regulator [Spirochaetota bacterium]